MKKIMIRIFVFILFVFIILQIAGCSGSALLMKPSDYNVASYNIVWTECERKIRTEYFPFRAYYRITDVPINEYVACRWSEGGVGAGEYPVLMKHKDFENSLELDSSSAKLYLGDAGLNLYDNDWFVYGQTIMKQEVAKIDRELAEELANDIASELIEFEDIDALLGDLWFQKAVYLRHNDGDVLRLTFLLKEYDNYIWNAIIVKCGDHYLIETKDGLHSQQYLLCNDEFSSVINEISEEYGLN